MRILWISHSCRIGGAELSMVEAVEALAERGHESHVVTPCDGPLCGRLRDVARVHKCHHNPWVTGQPTRRHAARWFAYNALIATPKMRRIVKSVAPSVIVSNTVTPIVGAMAAPGSASHVWFLHEFGRQDHGLTYLLGESATLRLMRRMADGFIVCSAALEEHFGGLLAPKVVENVTYAVEVPRPPPMTEASTAARPFRLVLVGQMGPSKGQHDAISAVARLVAEGLDVRLDLAGAGDKSYVEELRRSADAHGVGPYIRFLGFVDDPLRLMEEAHVALMCSRCEAFGRVTIEAMKLGKPVVGTASGGTLDLIRHGWNGFLYPVGDVTRLAKCVATLYHDTARREAMGADARAWAESEFNRDAYGITLERALGKICERSPS